MPFFTKPKWCLEKFAKDSKDYEHCGYNKNFVEDLKKYAEQPEGEQKEEYQILGYPSSNIIKLEPNTQAIMELVSYALLIYFSNLRIFIKKATKTALLRCGIISVLLMYLMTCNLLTITMDYRRSAT